MIDRASPSPIREQQQLRQRLPSSAALAQRPWPRPLIPLRARLSLPHDSAQDHSCPGCSSTGAPVSKDLFNFLLQGGVSNTQKMLPAALDEWAACPFHH